jgi:molybdate transport system regulatory protein
VAGGASGGATARRARAGAVSEGRLTGARPRLRIVLDDGARIGPGKIEVLEAIGATGSISAAGRSLGMSYRRAWLLATEVDRLFARPVLQTAAGGANGGGARLTEFGRALVAAYRRIEDRARDAIREELAPFESDLRDPAEPPPEAPVPPDDPAA